MEVGRFDMYIPIVIGITNKEKLYDVLMGNISPNDARELKERMTAEKKSRLIILAVCAVTLAICVSLVFLSDKFEIEINEYILLAIVFAGFVAPIFVAIFQAFSLIAPMQYLSALKRCRPGGNITSAAYRKYNLDKNTKRLPEAIAAHEFNFDEARGILNILNYELSGRIKAVVLMAFLSAASIIFFFIASPHIMTIEGEKDTTLKFMQGVPIGIAAMCAISVLIGIFRAIGYKKRIRAIEAAYTDASTPTLP
jgi:hypothetical protein